MIKKRTINYRIVFYIILTVLFFSILISYYYFYMRKTLKGEVYESLKRDAVYIDNKIMEVTDQSEEAAKNIGYTNALQKTIFSDDASEIIGNLATARELMNTERDNNEYIVDLFYHSDSGHLYTASEYYNQFRSNMKKYSFDKKIKLEQSFISSDQVVDRNSRFFFYYVPIHRTAMGIAHTSEANGLCAILIDYSPIVKNCEDLLGKTDTCYLLYNNIIISSINPIEGITDEYLSEFTDGEKKKSISGEDFYSYTLSGNKVKVVCLCSKKLVDIKSMAFGTTFYLLIAVSIFIFAMLLFSLNKEYTNKTNIMVEELNSMKLGAEKMRVTVPKVSELRDVAVEINSMLERLEEAAKREQEASEKLLSATVAQQNAEMTAYRSQINPHFFFNTLECVRSMAQYYNAEMIEDIITAMSKMFRYSLYSDRTVELNAELDMLEQYFVITSYRFPDRYVLKKDIEDGVLHYRVPSMILQPLVENCIKHAFSQNAKDVNNIVTVTAGFTDEGLLSVTVSDNGCGMTKEALEKLKETTFTMDHEKGSKDSIGIHNIYERIKLFDSRNTMEFTSELGKYTKVELILYSANL